MAMILPRLLIILFVFTYSSLVSAETPDNTPVIKLLDQMKQAYAKVDSFTTEMQLERFLPDYALQNQKVWFKRPQYIKLSQLGPFKEGAELAIKPDGSIRGHLGGFLSFVVVSLKPDDENLFGVTNDSAFNTDFDAIIEIAFELAQHMTHYEIRENTSKGRKQIILDSYYADDIDHYRLVIDAETMMLSGLERYRQNKLLHKIQWKQLRLNPAISNSEFDL